MGSIRAWLLVVWLSAKWIFRINILDAVKCGGKRYIVVNAVRPGMLLLPGLDNGDDGWVSRGDCRKTLTPCNLYGSFRNGYRLYMGNWYHIWKYEGVKDWMRKCNIW